MFKKKRLKQMKQTLVFFPGWASPPETMKIQKDFFSSKYNTIIINYANLGNNFEEVSSNIAKQLPNKECFFIAHSMGSLLSILVSNKKNIPIKGLAFIDFSIPLTDRKKENYATLSDNIKNNNSLQPALKTIENSFFIESDSHKEKKEITKLILSSDPIQSYCFLKEIIRFPTEKLLKEIKFPMLYIASEKPFGNIHYISKWFPKIQLAKVIGSGHFIQTFAKDQLHAILNRFFSLQNLQ
jgi:pimeloyl-ACP methyl ester carboxylesterase